MTVQERVKDVAPRMAADIRARVIGNVAVNPEYRHLILAAPTPATGAAPGQFFQLLCPQTGRDRPFLRRPMSIYRADAGAGQVEFLYKVTGAGTRGLAGLIPGDDLAILGPLGVGFSLAPAWRHIVVLGRGAGLATLAPLAEAAAARGLGVLAILSVRRPDLAMGVERLRQAGAEVAVVADSDAGSDPENVRRMLERCVAGRRADAFFTCGSNRLLKLMQDLARVHGIPGQVAMEQQMACGLGMCFCCVRPFRDGETLVHRRVCWEGPVFDLAEAVSW